MKKNITIALIVVTILFSLSGCSHEHDYISFVSKQPTCADNGVKTFKCKICGESYVEKISATGEHEYSESITKTPTCVKDGVKKYTCTICGKSYDEPIPATGIHSYKTSVNKEPTCVEEGTLLYKCTYCGNSYEEAISATNEHKYKEAATLKTATCLAGGEKEFKCTVCGDTRIEKTGVGDHTWTSSITTSATCTEKGVKTYTCTVCKKTKTESIPALGHTTDNGTCSRCGQNIKKRVQYREGQYKVGKDIPAGEYVLFVTNSGYMGYFSVSSDANGNNIIFNDNFDYNSIITIKDGQYLELSRCYAIDIDFVPTIDKSKGTMFKVGLHIPAGEYKIAASDSQYMGYYCIYESSLQNKIISNDNFNGSRYITVKNGQYLKLSRSKFVD
ncbi:MAG: hypothetical protein II135_05440 [Clostridia bacterium]|nr:hypothetical protein [Clostridia bacterium]